MPEEAPTYESKSNGEIEREIQANQEQFRAMKDGLEARVKERACNNSLGSGTC